MVKKKAVFAADIGGSKLLCSIVTPDGDILDTEKRSLGKDMTPERLEEHMIECYDALCRRNKGIELCGAGMTVPGVCDPRSGMWIYACFSGIKDYPITARMSALLGLPVTVENDANANAWGEKVFGCCKDCDDFLWVTVSNGVGGGLVMNGELYRGYRMGGGEIGHLVVETQDPLRCPCGHLGCMEAMAAGPGISARYKRLSGNRADAREIADRARRGEEAAVETMRMTAVYIGRGLGRAASLLNLERYVLGGGVMESYELLAPDIEKAFAEEAFGQPNADVKIVKTTLGYEAGLMSAAALAIRSPRKGNDMIPNEYLNLMKELLGRAEKNAFDEAVELIYCAMKSGRAIFVAGNGGSAATANHFAADFGKNVVLGNEGRPRVMSLCCNMSSVTAYANDEGYENAFARQLSNWAEKDDVLVVISASGNSPSVVKAAEFMHSRGGKVIGMTGFGGGELSRISDICLHAGDNRYETVEDAHSVFCHLIVSCVKSKL